MVIVSREPYVHRGINLSNVFADFSFVSNIIGLGPVYNMSHLSPVMLHRPICRPTRPKAS